MAKIIDTIRALEKEINDQGFTVHFSEPIEIEWIRKFEAQFNFSLPEDYIEFITTHGLLYFKHVPTDRWMCSILFPPDAAEDMEFVLDQEGEWSGNIVIFQKFDHSDRFDFYAFRRTGETVDVVSYFDDGATVRPVARTFTEHMEILLKSFIDGSYRNKYNADRIPYNKAAFDAEEQKQADRSAMLASFQEAGTFLNDKNNKTRLLKALELYDQTLAYFHDGRVVDDHFLLGANYNKAWVYFYLEGNCRQQFSGEEIHVLIQALIEQSKHTLTLIPANTNHHYHKDVIRVVNNSLAWYLAATTQQKEVLENALEIVQQGIDHIETQQHYFLYDT